LSMPVTTRVEDELADTIGEIARIEGMDRSTVVRRSLSKSVKNWLIETSLDQYEQDQVTLAGR